MRGHDSVARIDGTGNSAGKSKDPGAERWTGRLGVVLAVAGSAVGLGNFLRFPGQAAAHGGGAFMIPYFCALVLVGIPIGWAEWTMGRYGGSKGLHSAPAILGLVGRSVIARAFGVLGLLIPLVVYMYYGVIESWCLRYAWMFVWGDISLATGPEGRAAIDGVFAQVTGVNGDGVLFADGFGSTALAFFGIVFALNLWLVHRGLSRGIEAFCRWAMPAMAVCAVIVLIRVLTLGTPDPAEPGQNVLAGLGFMWNPDLAALADFETWLAAAGQVFFSLAVGFGVIINYASYVRREDDIVLSGLTASATNEVFEVGFGGMITVTAAFVFLGASGAIGGTFGLGFQTLPLVFAHMGAAGRLIGALWFFMLFLAAITSSLSMLQPLKAFLREALGLSGGQAVAVLGVAAGAGSLWVLQHSAGLTAIDTMDFWVGTFAIFVLAGVQIVVFGWVFGVDRGLEEASVGARMRIPRIFRFIMKWVAPAYLLVVFVGFCVQKLPGYLDGMREDEVARHTVIVMLVVLALLGAATWAGARRWNRMP